MAAAKIRKGDTVVVLSGKDKGKTGEVVRSMPKENKVVVSGVNVHARHQLHPIQFAVDAQIMLGNATAAEEGGKTADE